MGDGSRGQIDEIRERLENIIEATNVGTWEWEITTNKLIINERYDNILGYSLEELDPFNTDKWQEIAHKEDTKNANIVLSEHFKGESDFFDYEMRVKNKKGSWIWIRHRGKITKWDSDKSPIKMFGTISDETIYRE